MSWRPRLRTVLLASNLLVLGLPLAGISLLRLYDSMLIRQTEAELIVQGAAIAAVYRRALEDQALEAQKPAEPLDLDAYGRPVRARVDGVPSADPEAPFFPAIPGLDLARHPVLPPSPPAKPASGPADPWAAAAGRAVSPLLAEIQRTSLAGLRVVDPAGTVVASSGAELGLGLAHRPEVAAALDGFDAAVLRRRDPDDPTPPVASISRSTALRVVVCFPVRRGERAVGAVVLARTPLSARQALYRDRRYFLVGGAVLLGAVGLLAWALGALVAHPVSRLIEQVERVRRGRRADLPLPRPGTAEVDQISRAVADMASSLEQRADYIATFAANVSHEFKTPLTSIRGTVELLRDHLESMSPEQLERFLGMLEKDADRLDRLVERLLELARADTVQPSESSTPIGPVIAELVARFRAEGLAIESAGAPDIDGARVAMGAETLDSILSNLADNARQHGGPEVSVSVLARRCSLHERAAISLSVVDDGPGISRANQDRVFDRFFTTRRGEGGSGLGLSIVRSLVEAHGGRVRVESHPGRTAFEIGLPLAVDTDSRFGSFSSRPASRIAGGEGASGRAQMDRRGQKDAPRRPPEHLS